MRTRKLADEYYRPEPLIVESNFLHFLPYFTRENRDFLNFLELSGFVFTPPRQHTSIHIRSALLTYAGVKTLCKHAKIESSRKCGESL